TVTEGRPELTDVVVLAPGASRADVLGWAARAEAGSEHPLARPVLAAAAAEGLASPVLPEVVEPVPGKGIHAVTGGRRVLVGNAALLAEHGVEAGGADEAAERLAAAGRTPMLVALDREVLGVIAVADRVRPTARTLVDALHAAGVREVVMLTGDAPRSGRCRRGGGRSRWSAAASTPPPRSRPRTSGSRWLRRARRSRSRPRTSRS